MSRATSVMVVDDDEECREMLGEVLKSEGCTVFTADNGKHALDMLEHVRPDLLVVDLMMPVMDGWEFCSKLEQSPKLVDIPLVILSAVAGMRPAGRNRVLSKPVRLQTLIGLLDFIDAP